MSFALHLSSDGRSSHLLPPLLFPGEIQVLSQVDVCATQVPTAQTGWRREGDLRILTHSSLQSSSLQKTLLSYTTSHLMAMLLASLTAPPSNALLIFFYLSFYREFSCILLLVCLILV